MSNPHALCVLPTGPTLFLDALWLPYRRDPAALEAALAAASDSPAPLRAVFAHADIVSGQGEGGRIAR